MAYPALHSDDRLNIRRAIRGAASLRMITGQDVSLRLFDIGESGVGAISDVNLRQGGRGQLMSSVLLVPPAPMLIKYRVEVRYSVYCYRDGGFRVGLAFKEMDDMIAEAIKHYVSAPRYSRSLANHDVKIFA
jgi:hypothetical protein